MPQKKNTSGPSSREETEHATDPPRQPLTYKFHCVVLKRPQPQLFTWLVYNLAQSVETTVANWRTRVCKAGPAQDSLALKSLSSFERTFYPCTVHALSN